MNSTCTKPFLWLIQQQTERAGSRARHKLSAQRFGSLAKAMVRSSTLISIAALFSVFGGTNKQAFQTLNAVFLTCCEIVCRYFVSSHKNFGSSRHYYDDPFVMAHDYKLVELSKQII